MVNSFLYTIDVCIIIVCQKEMESFLSMGLFFCYSKIPLGSLNVTKQQSWNFQRLALCCVSQPFCLACNLVLWSPGAWCSCLQILQRELWSLHKIKCTGEPCGRCPGGSTQYPQCLGKATAVVELGSCAGWHSHMEPCLVRLSNREGGRLSSIHVASIRQRALHTRAAGTVGLGTWAGPVTITNKENSKQCIWR